MQMLRNISRLTFAADLIKLNLVKAQPIHNSSQSTSNLTAQPSVLNSPDLRELKASLEHSIVDRPLYNQIAKKILHLGISQKPFVDKRLEAKLNYKLALLVICFRRLTKACENDFLDDKAKLELIKEVVLNELKDKNTEEIQNEFEFLDLLGFNMDASYLEDDEMLLDFELVEEDGQENFMKKFLEKNGLELNKKEFFVEYSEDIVKSTDNEIECIVSDIRRDFPGVDKHVKELKCAVTKEWLAGYKDRFLNSRYNHFDFGWENEDGDPEFICP